MHIAAAPRMSPQYLDRRKPALRQPAEAGIKGARGRIMRAAFYDRNGSARDVLTLGEIETPSPGPGEVRVKLKTSGVNPSDVKGREGRTRKIAYPRVIPHSDGAGD